MVSAKPVDKLFCLDKDVTTSDKIIKSKIQSKWWFGKRGGQQRAQTKVQL